MTQQGRGGDASCGCGGTQQEEQEGDRTQEVGGVVGHRKLEMLLNIGS